MSTDRLTARVLPCFGPFTDAQQLLAVQNRKEVENRGDVDMHYAASLVRRGWPSGIAARIVLWERPGCLHGVGATKTRRGRPEPSPPFQPQFRDPVMQL